jgi:hypothetical protein
MANTTKANIFIRKYLTSEEINYIINEMLNRDNAFEREIVKVGMVAQLLVKDLGEFEDCNGVYDYVMENNIDLEKNIVNYSIIDKLVDKELSIDKFMKEFIISFDERINESMKNLDLNGAIKELKEVAESNKEIMSK